jgi:hypothetical protein
MNCDENMRSGWRALEDPAHFERGVAYVSPTTIDGSLVGNAYSDDYKIRSLGSRRQGQSIVAHRARGGRSQRH